MKSKFNFKFRLLAFLMCFSFIVGMVPAMSVRAAEATATPSPSEAPELEDKSYDIVCWPFLNPDRRYGYHYHFEADYYSFVKTHVFVFTNQNTGELTVQYFLYLFSMSPISVGMRRVYYPLTDIYDSWSQFNFSPSRTQLDGLDIYYYRIESGGFTGSPDSMRGYPNFEIENITGALTSSLLTSLERNSINADLQDLLFLYSGVTDWDDVFPPSSGNTDNPSHGGGGHGHGDSGYVDDAFDDDDVDYGIFTPVVRWFRAMVSSVLSIPRNMVDLLLESDLGQKIIEITHILLSFHAGLIRAILDSDLGQFFLDMVDHLRNIYDILVAFHAGLIQAILDSDLGQFFLGMVNHLRNIYDILVTFHAGLIQAILDSTVGQIFLGILNGINDVVEYFCELPLDLYVAYRTGSFWDVVRGIPESMIDLLINQFPIVGWIRESLTNFVNEYILLSADDVAPALENFMSVPIVATLRNVMNVLSSHMLSWGSAAPVITVPLSQTYLGSFGVVDMNIDFSWFDDYRQIVLNFERVFLYILFAYRTYFDIKNIINGAGGVANVIID